MMQIKWSSKALSDLSRLHEFLAVTNQVAAAKAIQALMKSVNVLAVNPRIGEQLFAFEPDEVRRLLVGHYEIRYLIDDSTVRILRMWTHYE